MSDMTASDAKWRIMWYRKLHAFDRQSNIRLEVNDIKYFITKYAYMKIRDFFWFYHENVCCIDNVRKGICHHKGDTQMTSFAAIFRLLTFFIMVACLRYHLLELLFACVIICLTSVLHWFSVISVCKISKDRYLVFEWFDGWIFKG